ncbi:MAG TPA: DUF885 domain-containing protein [Steroidobacteraceae bacterium]|nr:DUF885 domain-containing protein [Steroidobacteraceae bacterium]
MMHSVRPLFLTLLLVGSLAGCTRQSPPPPPPAPAPAPFAWDRYVSEFIEGYFKANPYFAVQAGRHEFDGQTPDLSAAGIARRVQWLKAQQRTVQAVDPRPMSEGQAFEREYLLNVIADQLFWLDAARFPFTNPAWYIDLLDPQVYLSRDYAAPEFRLRGYIGYARGIPQVAAQIRANLHVPMPRTLLERGIDGFGGYAQFYRHDVPLAFASVKDPAAQQELAQADEAAARAMEGLKSWLESERSRATEDFALGDALFLRMLKDTDDVQISLADLTRIGQQDLERNTQALSAACASYAPHRTLEQCVAKMSAHKPKGSVVQAAAEQLTELKAFVIGHHVVDIPSDNQVKVVKAPPYNSANFAFIEIPGPYDKNLASEYNIAPPDPHWSARERAEYIPGLADLLYTSVHEVWPGHFLQFSYSNRNPSKVAALWVTYAYAEGWAHYCEEMMWDEGLGNGSAEGHVGQLVEALLRDVRFISAIGLHTHGMSVADSEKLFRTRAFQDPGNARQQAARGTYDPAYINYTLGKLMIRKLRDDWVAQRLHGNVATDPKTLWRSFHNHFLSYGGPPIPLVRQEMVGAQGALF